MPLPMPMQRSGGKVVDVEVNGKWEEGAECPLLLVAEVQDEQLSLMGGCKYPQGRGITRVGCALVVGASVL